MGAPAAIGIVVVVAIGIVVVVAIGIVVVLSGVAAACTKASLSFAVRVSLRTC